MVSGGALGRIMSAGTTRPVGTCVNVPRSEEHTSELHSQSNPVCRLLLEKKNRIVAPSSTCSLTPLFNAIAPATHTPFATTTCPPLACAHPPMASLNAAVQFFLLSLTPAN